MAPGAIEPPAMTSLDDAVSKPPAGVVLPPKEIRGIIEKTAGYVKRNGVSFEDRIRQKELHNPKFSFLSANDAYNPFYQWRLDEIRAGRGTDVAAGRVGEAVTQELEKPKGPAAPPEFHFSARMPNINALDLEVVKLTALFVAKNGRSFMTTLSQREAGNYQFDFLRPQHSLYQFFSRLVDQYTELITGSTVDGGKPEKARRAQLERNVSDRFHMLARAKQRAEWVKWQESQKAKKEEEAEAEKMAYAQIDWHDFVVVETVLFNEADDQAELPPPTSLNDLQSASLEQKAMMSLQPYNMRIEEAMPTDEDPAYYDPAPAVLMPPPAAYPQQTPEPMPYMQQPVQEDEEDMRIRERTEARVRAQQAQAAAKGAGPMRIKSDYVPRAQANRKVGTALCPNCFQQIPYDELDQHLRIELLDPSWKEQKAKSDARYSTTNLSTSDVANNLKRLASQRSDVFDPVTGAPLNADEAARQKKPTIPPLGYDGVSDAPGPPGSVGAPGIAAQGRNMNIEEQLKWIKEKAARQ